MMDNKMSNGEDEIPVIDLSGTSDHLLAQIHLACSTWGFFQLINHDISPDLISDFRRAKTSFFDLPYETKVKLKRNAKNARGYFDDELTKRRRDWKECLDVGVPGGRDWSLPDCPDRGGGGFGGGSDGGGEKTNECLDGYNQFPTPDECPDCPNFREVVITYFEECARLSNTLAKLMARALGVEDGSKKEEFLERLRKNHTSYLRMNYYPPCEKNGNGNENNNINAGNGESSKEPLPLGISPHRDAGFLTILLQDDDCHSLQVARFEDSDDDSNQWVTVHPLPGSLTVNTGDMAMIWSNGIFRAPLHRVLTDPSKKRYSAPFFYNPGYNEMISPVACCCSPMKSAENVTQRVSETTLNDDKSPNNGRSGLSNNNGDHSSALQPIQYNPCLWGYFRALRFAGDLTDLGVEIQTSHFKVGSESRHVERQRKFREVVNFEEAFDVEKYRDILEAKD